MFQFPAFTTLITPMNSVNSDGGLLRRVSAFKYISEINARLPAPRKLFAGCRVFHRLSMPRHPPYTLKSLATFIDHRQNKGLS